MRKAKGVIYWLSLLAVRCAYYFYMGLGNTNSDTPSFVDYMVSGCCRTPGYPLLIDVFQFIQGDRYYIGLCIFQAIVSFFSLFVLLEIMNLIVDANKRYISYILLTFYALNPVIVGWDTCVLAESLSISVTIFFIYYCFQFIDTFQVKYGVGAAVISLIGTSIKTALFIYTFDLMILIVIILATKRKQYKALFKVAVATTLVVMVYAVWMGIIYHYCGIFGFSNLSVKHQIVKSLQSGMYHNHYEKEVVTAIDSILEHNDMPVWKWDILTPVYQAIGGDDAHKLEWANYCLNYNRMDFLKFQLGTMISAFKEPFILLFGLEGFLNVIATVYYKLFRVGSMYALLFVFLIYTLILVLKKKTVPYKELGIAGGMFTIIVSVFWGSYGDWWRLLIYIMPFAFVAMTFLANAVISIASPKK